MAKASNLKGIKFYSNFATIRRIREQLASSGVIVGELEIEDYLGNKGFYVEDVVKYFKTLYGPQTRINRGQQETTVLPSPSTEYSESTEFQTLKVNSMPSFTLSGSNMISNLDSLKEDTLQQDAKDIFIDMMVTKSRLNEEQDVIALSNIGNRDAIIRFLNSVFEIDSAKQDRILQNNQNLINLQYASELIEKRLSGVLKYDPDQKANKEERDLIKLIKLLEDGVADAKQFSGLIYALSDIQMIADPVQAKKSGKTLNEMIALLNLKQQSQALITSKAAVQATAYSAGSESVPQFHARVKDSNNPTFIMNEARKFSEELISEKKRTGDKYTSLSIGQQFYSASGSQATKNTIHAADLVFEVDNKKKYIDVKIGIAKNKSGGLGSRYNMSSPLRTSISSIYNNSLLNQTELDKFFRQIEIIMNYFFYQMTSRKKPDFNNTDMKKIITYALLSSNVFVYYYRSVFLGDQNTFIQPSWLLTRQGYVWYSDFFSVVADTLFAKSRMQTVSLQLKYAFKDATKLAEGKAKDKLLKKQRQEDIVALMDLLDKMKISVEEQEDFQTFANLFINSNQVYFTLNVDNIFDKVQSKLSSLTGVK